MSSVISAIKDAVIVRGYGGKPGRLIVSESRGDVIFAYGKDENAPMGFYADHVFEFNATIFRKLQKAFESKDSEELERLWLKARPFNQEGTDTNE